MSGTKLKKTQEQFLKELYERNKFYRAGEFKVVGKYQKNDVPILLKNKYGYLKSRPSDLLIGKSPLTTNSALFKTLYFKEYLSDMNKHYYKRKFKIVGEYEGNKIHMLLENKYGMMLSTPGDLLTGKSPSIKSAIDKRSYFCNMLKERNLSYKNGKFEVVEYNGRGVNDVCIVSDEFGLYRYYTGTLLTGVSPTLASAIDMTDNIKNRFKKVHGETYDYSKILVNKNHTEGKLPIICKIHGLFKQKYYNHLIGEGCSKCGKIRASLVLSQNPTGWSYSTWIESSLRSKNFESFKCYVLKFTSRICDEIFYKIGRTYLNIRKRFAGLHRHYDIEEICIFESENPEYVINKELELLKINKPNKYIPKINFGGYHECFKSIKIDD